MNLEKPQKEKIPLKGKIIYIIAIVACLLCLIFVVTIGLKVNTGIAGMLDTSQAELTSLGNKTQEEIDSLKTLVNNKFTN